MEPHPQPRSDRGVQFIDESGAPLDFADHDGGRTWWHRLAATSRPSWSSMALSGVSAVAATATIIGVFFPQLTFRLGVLGPTYAMDGFGRYHLHGRESPRVALDGHAPALGAVALVGAVVLLVTVTVALFLERGHRVLASVACLAAGGMAAGVACEAVEGAAFEKYRWSVGFWVLVAGAGAAGFATLCDAARSHRPD